MENRIGWNSFILGKFHLGAFPEYLTGECDKCHAARETVAQTWKSAVRGLARIAIQKSFEISTIRVNRKS
jgi:hypothetical protein